MAETDTLAVHHDGRNHVVDDLPLAVIDKVERETGQRWDTLVKSPRGLAAIASALIGADASTLSPTALRVVGDDRPVEYVDGLPSAGGWTADRFVVMFGRPPWCWPPDVTRRQTLRDLLVLAESFDEGD